jgi:hypothetical protein
MRPPPHKGHEGLESSRLHSEVIDEDVLQDLQLRVRLEGHPGRQVLEVVHPVLPEDLPVLDELRLDEGPCMLPEAHEEFFRVHLRIRIAPLEAHEEKVGQE